MLLKVAVRRERDQESTARVALEKEASSLRERMHEMEAHASARSGGRGGGGGGGIEMILFSFGRRQQAGDARGRSLLSRGLMIFLRVAVGLAEAFTAEGFYSSFSGSTCGGFSCGCSLSSSFSCIFGSRFQ